MTGLAITLAIVAGLCASAAIAEAVAFTTLIRTLLAREKELLDRIQAPDAAAVTGAMRLGERTRPPAEAKQYARTVGGTMLPIKEPENA
jgi:hypothetical protein